MTTSAIVAGPELTEWDVTVTMARRLASGATETRVFTTTMPAADQEHAETGGFEFGLAINTASGYVWKLADERPVVRAAQTERSARSS